ncbi:MAG: thiolase family protein, partial [Chloroflexi bacterium]|nr:thiolase family protein [Chloroflexota bacterium]
MTKRTNAVIVGGGVSKFGVREAHILDLFQEAAKACSDDISTLKPTDIDGLIVCSTMAGRHSSALNTAPLVAHRLGLKPTSICIRIDTLCAGSNSGIIVAKGMIESGIAEVILVTGAEKVYMPQRWETNYTQLMVNDHDWDSAMGLGVPPPFFAMIAKMHMKRYGTTKEQMAHVAVANYNYGATNPKGHFYPRTLTMDEALSARLIADPFGLFDCCPLSDGASAVIIASEQRAKGLSDRPLVYIRGTGQHATHSMSAGWPGETLAEWPHLKKAAEVAYKNAQVSAKDIDVAQVHDCFTISEIIEVEELGFCKKGEGGDYIALGAVNIEGERPINSDVGLFSHGYPFGGSGACQFFVLCKQLQGRATNQVKYSKIALGL